MFRFITLLSVATLIGCGTTANTKQERTVSEASLSSFDAYLMTQEMANQDKSDDRGILVDGKPTPEFQDCIDRAFERWDACTREAFFLPSHMKDDHITGCGITYAEEQLACKNENVDTLFSCAQLKIFFEELEEDNADKCDMDVRTQPNPFPPKSPEHAELCRSVWRTYALLSIAWIKSDCRKVIEAEQKRRERLR